MLSTDKKFLFIHIPKTGGNSVAQALIDLADDETVNTSVLHDGEERFELRHDSLPTSKHSPAVEYKRLLAKEDYEGLFKFACVRNPWERAVSRYFHAVRDRGPLVFTPEKKGHEDEGSEVEPIDRMAFFDFVTQEPLMLSYLYTGDDPERDAATFDPFEEFDFIMRFENLENDFANVCGRLGVSGRTLGMTNKSNHAHYSRYYNEELFEFVAKMYSLDIQRFGYVFEEG